jgi:hypothetical protein
MKKKFFLLATIAGIATSCATSTVSSLLSQSVVEPPVYLTGRDEPAASSNFSQQSQLAVEPPMYFTGQDEPAAYGFFISEP